jgi:hypothetical protein
MVGTKGLGVESIRVEGRSRKGKNGEGTSREGWSGKRMSRECRRDERRSEDGGSRVV